MSLQSQFSKEQIIKKQRIDENIYIQKDKKSQTQQYQFTLPDKKQMGNKPKQGSKNKLNEINVDSLTSLNKMNSFEIEPNFKEKSCKFEQQNQSTFSERGNEKKCQPQTHQYLQQFEIIKNHFFGFYLHSYIQQKISKCLYPEDLAKLCVDVIVEKLEQYQQESLLRQFLNQINVKMNFEHIQYNLFYSSEYAKDFVQFMYKEIKQGNELSTYIENYSKLCKQKENKNLLDQHKEKMKKIPYSTLLQLYIKYEISPNLYDNLKASIRYQLNKKKPHEQQEYFNLPKYEVRKIYKDFLKKKNNFIIIDSDEDDDLKIEKLQSSNQMQEEQNMTLQNQIQNKQGNNLLTEQQQIEEMKEKTKMIVINNQFEQYQINENEFESKLIKLIEEFQKNKPDLEEEKINQIIQQLQKLSLQNKSQQEERSINWEQVVRILQRTIEFITTNIRTQVNESLIISIVKLFFQKLL